MLTPLIMLSLVMLNEAEAEVERWLIFDCLKNLLPIDIEYYIGYFDRKVSNGKWQPKKACPYHFGLSKKYSTGSTGL